MDLITTGAALAVANKLLGKTADTISQDLAAVYTVGRDRIVQFAIRKVKNQEDGAIANLRVARDVFWNGSYSDESICAEYFGGILASSRSLDGKDDSGVFYLDIIKSMSSAQLTAHYIIYRTLNKFYLGKTELRDLNPGMSTELQKNEIYFPIKKLEKQVNNPDLVAVLHGLASKDLLHSWLSTHHELGEQRIIRYLRITPTPLGVQLFAIANNNLDKWKEFSTYDFNDFENVEPIELCEDTLEKLVERIRVLESLDSKAN